MKNYKLQIVTIFIGLFIMAAGTRAGQVLSLDRLLSELSDPLTLIEPAPYRAGMVSTWDRSGGNDDGYNFQVREGDVVTLFNMAGPGVVTRIFSAEPGGLVKMYLDGSDEPFWTGTGQELFSGKNEPFLGELTGCDSGCHSYVPIPFAERLTIKIEYRKPVEPDRERGFGAYWHVSYRSYPAGYEVKSLELPLHESERELIENALSRLLISDLNDLKEAKVKVEILPGKSLILYDKKDTGIVEKISLVPADIKDPAWQDLRLRMYWDGEPEPSFDCPLGFLMLPGRGTFALAMPYEQARIELYNDGPQRVGQFEVLVNYRETVKPLSGFRLHGSFGQQWTRNSGAGPNLSSENNYRILKTTGRGLYVGTVLRVYNIAYIWWGEGDEMIFVDGDTWPPSFHGTGTEDYFDSAWKRFGKSPFAGAVYSNSLNRNFAGDNLLYRLHIADPIPFNESIDVSIEHGYFTNDLANFYSSLALWYQPEPHRSRPAVPEYGLRVLDDNYMKSLVDALWLQHLPFAMKLLYVGLLALFSLTVLGFLAWIVRKSFKQLKFAGSDPKS